MALTKTIDEIKEVLPSLVSNLNDTSLLPNFDEAEVKYLVPIIGQGLYDDLQGKYTGNTLTDEEKLLCKHIRLVVIAYAFMDNQGGNVVLTDAGLRSQATNDMPQAFGWQYKEFKLFLRTKALDGTEVLLNYLWAKKADYALWTASDEYKAFEGLLIKTATDFNAQYSLYQPSRTYYALRNTIRDCQKEFIISGIGKDLLSYFISANPTDDEKDILDELKKALAFFTIARAADHFAVRFSDGQFTLINAFSGGDRENSEEAGRSSAAWPDIQRAQKACMRDGQKFMVKAKKLLVALRADVDATAGFIAAYDAGPLVGYVDPSERTKGNENRTTYRF